MAWALIFAAASPWIRLTWGEWVIYPGHWLLSIALWHALLRTGRPRRSRRHLPLKPALALGVYLCLMAGLRGQWELLAFTAGALALNYGWGLAAFRLGTADGGTGSIPEGMSLLLGAVLLMGLAGWGATFFWPPLCHVLNCPFESRTPYVFLGAWAGHGQYWLYVLLNLPLACTLLLLLYGDPRHGRNLTVLATLIGGAVMALLAGARLWTMLLMAVAIAGVMWRLAPLARPGDKRLVQAAALLAVVEMLVVYGLFPGYLSMAARGTGGGGLLKIEYAYPPRAALSSVQDTLLRLQLTNEGVITLAGDPGRPLWLAPRLLVTPGRGETRAFDVGRAPVPGPLPPGKWVELELPVRLPHWAREGYLAWRLEDGERRGVRLTRDSELGFRFVNEDYRNFSREEGNYLSALGQRAREAGAGTFVPEASRRDPDTAANLAGRALDSLFFSPLWGLAPVHGEKRYPFSAPGPFWAQLFQEYGIFGVIPALLFGIAVVRRSQRIGSQSLRFADRILWRLVPLMGVLVMLTGIFSPVLGSFHAIWGLFLLSGYVEGKYWHLFAQRPELSKARTPRKWFGLFGRRTRKFPAIKKRGRLRWAG